MDLKNIFFENLPKSSLIFKKYFENLPKIIFKFFWHFCTLITILNVWWNFQNHSIFPSYLFCKLKIRHWIIRPGEIFPYVIGCFPIIYMFRIIKLIQNMIKRWFQNKFLSLLKISRATNTFLGGYFALKIEIYTFFWA